MDLTSKTNQQHPIGMFACGAPVKLRISSQHPLPSFTSARPSILTKVGLNFSLTVRFLPDHGRDSCSRIIRAPPPELPTSLAIVSCPESQVSLSGMSTNACQLRPVAGFISRRLNRLRHPQLLVVSRSFSRYRAVRT